MPEPLHLAFVRFTSCSGCQLALVNAEEALPLLPEVAVVQVFPLVSSAVDAGAPLDVALIEGSVSRPEELEMLLTLRRRARFVVAVGACAVNGGINVLGGTEREAWVRAVYGAAAAAKRAFLPQPLDRLVKVDAALYGCPVAAAEIVQLLGAVARGGLPPTAEHALCLDCRLREIRCLLVEGQQPCLGPVTRSGCGVQCPARGIPCEGCHGFAPEANLAEMERQLAQIGFGSREIRARMERFGGVGHDRGAD
ncbi:MAG TPA: NADH:ubiquinone oxidoreductase [Desulfuromonas sp.]|nr:NADH:ubiquinone oxidoreductase [Desulfuromonas sp.]